MTEFDAQLTLETIGQFKGSSLALNCFGESPGSYLPTSSETQLVFEHAEKIGFAELLLTNRYHTYEEPDFETVEHWVDGLGLVTNDNLKQLVIHGMESYARVGDITPLLTQFRNLTELFVVGRTSLTSVAHPRLERLSLEDDAMDCSHAETIGSLNCPNLKYLALRPSGRGDGPPDGFGHILIKALNENPNLNVEELLIEYSDQSAEILEELCKTGMVGQLKLLQLTDNELCYDAEDAEKLLLDNAAELKQLNTLRVPLRGLMDNERAEIQKQIPNIENSNPEYPETHAWMHPFNPDKYGSDKFDVKKVR